MKWSLKASFTVFWCFYEPDSNLICHTDSSSLFAAELPSCSSCFCGSQPWCCDSCRCCEEVKEPVSSVSRRRRKRRLMLRIDSETSFLISFGLFSSQTVSSVETWCRFSQKISGQVSSHFDGFSLSDVPVETRHLLKSFLVFHWNLFNKNHSLK